MLCFLFLLSASYAWRFLLLLPCYVSPTDMSSPSRTVSEIKPCLAVVFDRGVLSQTRKVTSALLAITYSAEMGDRSTWSFLLLLHRPLSPVREILRKWLLFHYNGHWLLALEKSEGYFQKAYLQVLIIPQVGMFSLNCLDHPCVTGPSSSTFIPTTEIKDA